jgi:hypothetical protein
MKFQKGHKLAKGGKREGAGRPTKIQAEIKKAATEIAREFIEEHIQGFLDSYLDLGTGKVIERLDKEGNVVKLVMLDPATVRHAIDKLVPTVQKIEHGGEMGVRPWIVDAYEPKKPK